MARLAGSVSPCNGRPSMSTVPESGRTNPAIIDTVVVFPAPFGPSRPIVSPLPAFRLTPSTATMSP
jgi:hypothetical protein